MGGSESHPACSVAPGPKSPSPQAGVTSRRPPLALCLEVCLCILASSWLPELLGSSPEADFQLQCPLGDHNHYKHSQAETSRAGSLSLFSSQHKPDAVTHPGGRGRGGPPQAPGPRARAHLHATGAHPPP